MSKNQRILWGRVNSIVAAVMEKPADYLVFRKEIERHLGSPIEMKKGTKLLQDAANELAKYENGKATPQEQLISRLIDMAKRRSF